MRILIIEDERELAFLLTERMRAAGFVIDRVATATAALDAIRAYDYPIVLLDRRLPDADGISIIPEIRRMRSATRILVVSALRDIDDRVEGLDAGADDYLTKPFDTNELLARVRANLRRPGNAALPPVVVGDLTFDVNTREANIAGRPLLLFKREALMLESLMRRAGRVVTHATLIDELYGFDETAQLNALKTLASRLRRRLESCDAKADVRSVRGVGYLIRAI
ncbi:DNA-binding response regulator [Methylosinus sp. C49]|uniref:response regulator transcription factor n=1 Tax=Methylosinus sp. C49 TaxID=2699395 RepID=UPI001366961F|nr:response regulator transcription factor [Methylosinus sp. C49]BBU60468.1 DNA-binding response regulator [Methylosinus sp. C49]